MRSSGEVQRCPAVPTDIGRWRGAEEEKKKKKARRAILKSNNPHLAGREKGKLDQHGSANSTSNQHQPTVPTQSQAKSPQSIHWSQVSGLGADDLHQGRPQAAKRSGFREGPNEQSGYPKGSIWINDSCYNKNIKNVNISVHCHSVKLCPSSQTSVTPWLPAALVGAANDPHFAAATLLLLQLRHLHRRASSPPGWRPPGGHRGKD